MAYLNTTYRPRYYGDRFQEPDSCSDARFELPEDAHYPKLILSNSDFIAMPSTYDNRSQKKRPLGITILCILGVIGVVIAIFGSFGLMARGGPGPILGLFVLALSVGQAVVLYGLWTLQRWGYKWALVLYGLSAVLDLVTGSILSLIIDVLIIAYLLSKERYFE